MDSTTPSTKETPHDIFSIHADVSLWEAIITIIILGIIVIITIVGNIFVILGVFTYRPLRSPQNIFIVSLAVADITVAVIVMPINIVTSVTTKWMFGSVVCKLWLTCDILCCTASILNLCAIALDRYWAITNPLHYSQQRTIKRVLLMILAVWVISAIISSPPLLGWNDWDENSNKTCSLSQKEGYVVYSSLGSFYIPLLIMTTIYSEIFLATRRRLRDRVKAANYNYLNNVQKGQQSGSIQTRGRDSVTSETSSQSDLVSPENAQAGPKDKLQITPKVKLQIGPKVIFADPISQKKIEQNIEVAEDSTTDDQDVLQEPVTPSECDTPRTRTIRSIFGASFLPRTFSINSSSSNIPEPTVQQCPAGSSQIQEIADKRKRISLSKERRAARTLGIIMGVFVICWLPFFLMYVILPFKMDLKPSPKFVNFITWLGYINSALNPFIYTIFNTDFRRAFKKLLKI